MVRTISLLGWVLITFTVLLIISLFVSLFSRLKEKGREEKWITAMRNAGNSIRDPFAEENRKIQELSERVDLLRTPSKNEPQSDNGTLKVGEEE